MLHFSVPTLRSDASGRHFVSFQCEGRRHRFFSADILGLDIRPNKARGKERDILAQRLTVAFHSALLDGWSPRSAQELPAPDITTAFEAVTAFEPAPHLSSKYAGELRGTRQRFLGFLKKKGLDSLLLRELTQSHCQQYLEPLPTPSTFNHERQRLAAILRPALSALELKSPTCGIPQRKVAVSMHEPFSDVGAVLKEIEAFNSNLHLCCLITYGCLLRPHKEVRELSWQDFSEGLTCIKLSGSRNKSKRVRVVPVPEFVREALKGRRKATGAASEDNIFSLRPEAYNASYFKSLWTLFKKQSQNIKKEQTLYSFRHSAALDLFARTGDLRKLSAAMGHNTLEVTLGYLKHMARTELSQEDMPQLKL